MIDPRTLVPLDWDTISRRCRRTGRLVVVDPAHRRAAPPARSPRRSPRRLRELRGPIVRVTTPDIQIPFSPALERQLYPSEDKVVAAIGRTLA